MLQIWTCLIEEHDYSLVALAAIACVFGAAVSIRLHERAAGSDDSRRYGWLFLAGLAFGSTVWTTHFLAMLGYSPAIAHGYDPVATIISLFIAIFVALAGFTIAATRHTRVHAATGGAVIGAGVGCMHFVGMSGFMVAGRIAWDSGLVAASLVAGIILGALAFNLPFLQAVRRPKLAATLTLVGAVVALHFTAMGAVTIVPDPTIAVPEQIFSKNILGAAVLAMMTLVVSVGISTNLIDKKSSAEALEHYRHLAMHDPMTGLANRSHAQSLLQGWIEDGARSGRKIALLAIDLNRFKYVNDVYGHHAGDALLKSIADHMRAATRGDETVARVGGDEFAALKHFDGDISEVLEFAGRILEAVCHQACVEGRLLSIACSIGIAVCPDNASSVNELSVCADLAMYRAKRQGAEKICVYDRSLDDAMRQRGEIAVELAKAIQNEEFELHYQPQLSISEHRLIGFEALVRWRRPDGTLVPPSEFIAIAEETGQIIEIGEWVLRKACADAASWDEPYAIAINVSPVQIAQSDLPDRVLEALADTGLQASRLEIEITESVLLGDVAHTLHILRRLKALGVRIAMDDFGTGYSSLSSLQSFPFDKIKIDQSFVRGVGVNAQSDSIVRAIISLAHSLSIPVVAEGVETEGHLAFLRTGNCDHAQGYLLSRPVPAAQLEALIARGFMIADETGGEMAMPATAVAV